MPDIYESVDAISLLRVRNTHGSIRVDYDGGTNPVYVGWAKPGSLDVNPVWTIAKITYDGSGNFASLQWADGNIEYDNVWSDRASLTYS